MERLLIADYRAMVEDVLSRFDLIDFDIALPLARIPEQIGCFLAAPYCDEPEPFSGMHFSVSGPGSSVVLR